MNGIKAIFWNPQQRRLRSGWRLVIQLGLFFAILVALAVVTKTIGQSRNTAIVGTSL